MPEETLAPRSCGALFSAFSWLALQGFGGVLPVAQRALVERHRWLTRQQFLDMLSTAQVLPGPNVVNLALMIGDRFLGWRGALAAMAGILLAPLVVVLLLAVLARHWQAEPAVAGALRGMGLVAAGLVLTTAFRLAAGLRGNALGKVVCAALVLAAALAIGVLRLPLPPTLLALGGAACWLAWRRLAP